MTHTIERDTAGLFLTLPQGVARAAENTRFQLGESVYITQPQLTHVTVQDTANPATAYQESWLLTATVVVIASPTPAPPAFRIMKLVTHTGLYLITVSVLCVAAFDLGLVCGWIWTRLL